MREMREMRIRKRVEVFHRLHSFVERRATIVIMEVMIDIPAAAAAAAVAAYCTTTVAVDTLFAPFTST
jgi:hypothetical protein